MADQVISAVAEVSTPALDDVTVWVDTGSTTRYKISSKRLLGQLHHVCQGRLTLTSGVAITTADVTGATNIYWTPYNGDQIDIYDGTRWVLHQFTEATIALGTLTSASNYDIFAWDNAGTLSYKIGPAWTSNTARGTGAGTTQISLQNGVYVNTVAITSGPGALAGRYLGSFRTTSTTTTEDSAGGTTTTVGGKKFLFNAQNQVTRTLFVKDTTSSWSYTTQTFRIARGATAPVNCVEFLQGLLGQIVDASVLSSVNLESNSGFAASVGVGLNSATNLSYNGIAYNVSTLVALQLPLTAVWKGYGGLGYNDVRWLEYGADGTCLFLGSGGAGVSGLICTIFA